MENLPARLNEKTRMALDVEGAASEKLVTDAPEPGVAANNRDEICAPLDGARIERSPQA
jgi:hypothetical protein